MSTVQAQMGRLAQRIDPVTSAGVSITAANVGTVDGARFSKNRLLDTYNEARMTLANVIQQKLDPVFRREAVANNVLSVVNITFASGAANKPAGYVSAILMRFNATKQIITVLPAALKYATQGNDGLANPLVYEQGIQFVSANGNAYIPDAANYLLDYFGVSYFILTDVTGGVTVETFNQIWEPTILEIAQAIGLEQGLAQVLALTDTLVGGGKQ